jgi:RNA polymerase sigma-70 factor (ECF subfamily)
MAAVRRQPAGVSGDEALLPPRCRRRPPGRLRSNRGQTPQARQSRLLDAYIYRIARNEAVSYTRRRRRDRKDEAAKDFWLEASEAGQERTDIVELLEVALSRLPESQRQAVVLKVYRDKTFEEIARIVGISLNTAAGRYRYGMERLRTLLKERLS